LAIGHAVVPWATLRGLLLPPLLLRPLLLLLLMLAATMFSLFSSMRSKWTKLHAAGPETVV